MINPSSHPIMARGAYADLAARAEPSLTPGPDAAVGPTWKRAPSLPCVSRCAGVVGDGIHKIM